MAKRATPSRRRVGPSWKFEIVGEGIPAPTKTQIDELKEIFRLTALATLRVRKAGALDRMFVKMKTPRR
jgi:hypothetical protein